jgi:hypothetical protein
MSSVVRALTQQEILDAQAQSQAIANAGTPAVKEGQFIFFAAFDGTNNDKNNLAVSGTTQQTNVGQLFDQIEQLKPISRNLETGYYPGPGTNGSLPGSSAIPFQVTQQIIKSV